MTEVEKDFTESGFDPGSFILSSPLRGIRGVVTEPLFIRHNYGGRIVEDATALRVTVRAAGLEKARTNLYSCGALHPAELAADGKLAKALAGAFLGGGSIDKRQNVARFLANLKAAGFPMEKIGRPFGIVGLTGAEITWKTLEVPGGNKGETKALDVPSEFHGFLDAGAIAALGGDASEAAGQQTEALAVPVDDETTRAAVIAAVVAAVQESEGKEIPRGQLSAKVGPKLKDHPQRTRALSLLLQDSFLAAIPGVTYDRKTIKLSV